MSKYYRVNLDIGHFTAANFDAVDYIRKNHQHIVLLHLKDRKKNEGPNVPWGEGDTPIKQVLALLKETKHPIPAFIEYEYKGPELLRKKFSNATSTAKERSPEWTVVKSGANLLIPIRTNAGFAGLESRLREGV